MSNELPKTITATKVAFYDVSKIVEDILENDTERTLESITLEEIMDIVEEYASEDLTSVYKEILFTDDLGRLNND